MLGVQLTFARGGCSLTEHVLSAGRPGAPGSATGPRPRPFPSARPRSAEASRGSTGLWPIQGRCLGEGSRHRPGKAPAPRDGAARRASAQASPVGSGAGPGGRLTPEWSAAPPPPFAVRQERGAGDGRGCGCGLPVRALCPAVQGAAAGPWRVFPHRGGTGSQGNYRDGLTEPAPEELLLGCLGGCG